MPETLPAFPMTRAARCPFDPPPRLRQVEPVSRLTIWDRSTPWLVTDYETQRAVLSDQQRFSADTSKSESAD